MDLMLAEIVLCLYSILLLLVVFGPVCVSKGYMWYQKYQHEKDDQ